MAQRLGKAALVLGVGGLGVLEGINIRDTGGEPATGAVSGGGLVETHEG